MVFDYVAGKQDWLASDLPIEGQLADTVTVGALADRNVPTCFLTEKANDVQDRLVNEHRDFSVVIDGARVVLGLLRTQRVENGDPAIARFMEAGPSTFRPHTMVEQIADYVVEKNSTRFWSQHPTAGWWALCAKEICAANQDEGGASETMANVAVNSHREHG